MAEGPWEAISLCQLPTMPLFNASLGVKSAKKNPFERIIWGRIVGQNHLESEIFARQSDPSHPPLLVALSLCIIDHFSTQKHRFREDFYALLRRLGRRSGDIVC